MPRILLDPNAVVGGGGNENAFIAALPPELQKEPSLQTFKDPGTLAKSYVEAQKLIGAKRVAIPSDTAPEAEWEKFYNSIGRPETVDKYETVDLKNEKGEVIFKPDQKEADELKKFFHKMGLTGKQAKMMQEYSLKYVHGNMTAKETQRQQEANAAQDALKQEWGDKFGARVDTARAVITKFAGDSAPEVLKFMDESGLGNNVPLVKLMAQIGDAMLEDRGNRGTGGSLPISDSTRAQQEIGTLLVDKEFQDALGSAQHPAHQAAVNRWVNLHKMAHPGTEKE